jgi:hypothetical protein
LTQPFKREFPKPGITADDGRVTYFTRIAEAILAATAVVLLVAVLAAAELRLTPEQRMDLFNVTTYAAP